MGMHGVWTTYQVGCTCKKCAHNTSWDWEKDCNSHRFLWPQERPKNSLPSTHWLTGIPIQNGLELIKSVHITSIIRVLSSLLKVHALQILVKRITNSSPVNGHSRILNWRYLPYIRPIFRPKFQGISPPNMAKHMLLTYLHFRILKISHWTNQYGWIAPRKGRVLNSLGLEFFADFMHILAGTWMITISIHIYIYTFISLHIYTYLYISTCV